MSGLQYISTRSEGRTFVVTIERPEVMNALHPPAHAEMAAAFDALAADPDLWVAVLTGRGERAFCAGNDLKYHATGAPLTMPDSGFAGITRRFDLTKPLIAAVNGLALGGGFETALACDIVIAGTHAKFGLPEPRVGLAALAGGLLRLPQAIGTKQAMPIILSGKPVTAEEGYRLGFVSELTAPGEELDRALALAETIAECSPLAVRAAKQVASRAFEVPLAEAMVVQFGWPAVDTMRTSADWVEGPRAFAEKRPPQWSGR